MNLIHSHGEIIIHSDLRNVFEYFSNPENDKSWRKEINGALMNSKPQKGAVFTEDSRLSKKVTSNILKFVCIEFIEYRKAVYETIPGSDFYQKSTREIENVSENTCKVLYTISFDKNIVKHGLGFNLPTFLINAVVKRDMTKYLSELKRILEQSRKNK